MNRYLLLLSLLLPVSVFAQVSLDEKQRDLLGQGRVNAGVSIGGGNGGTVGAVGHVAPRVQYFLKDGWSIAVEGRYIKRSSAFTYMGAGLSTRYYFLRSKRVAVFAQAGATYGKATYRAVEPGSPYQTLTRLKPNAWQTNAGVGAHYRLGKRWSLEGTVERSQFPKDNLNPDFSRWQGNIGLNYRLK